MKPDRVAGVSGTSSPWWWGTAGSVMSGRCVELREMSPGGREMATSGGEREERKAWTHDSVKVQGSRFLYLSHDKLYRV